MTEQEITAKWEAVINKLQDGKSVAIRRDTVAAGVTKPFGTLTRNGNLIQFTPAKRYRGYHDNGFKVDESKAAKELTDAELMSAFFI